MKYEILDSVTVVCFVVVQLLVIVAGVLAVVT